MDGFKITECWMVIATEEETGDEGLPAIRGQNNMLLPLVGTDRIRQLELEKFAQDLTDETGKELKLVHFTKMEVLKVFKRKPRKNEN